MFWFIIAMWIVNLFSSAYKTNWNLFFLRWSSIHHLLLGSCFQVWIWYVHTLLWMHMGQLLCWWSFEMFYQHYVLVFKSNWTLLIITSMEKYDFSNFQFYPSPKQLQIRKYLHLYVFIFSCSLWFHKHCTYKSGCNIGRHGHCSQTSLVFHIIVQISLCC